MQALDLSSLKAEEPRRAKIDGRKQMDTPITSTTSTESLYMVSECLTSVCFILGRNAVYFLWCSVVAVPKVGAREYLKGAANCWRVKTQKHSSLLSIF